MNIVFDINALLVDLAILFAIVMWGMVWKVKFTVPIVDVAKIFTVAFGMQLVIYSVFSFVLLDIQLRAYIVRTSIIVICLSQAIPLLIAYRTWKHGQRNPQPN